MASRLKALKPRLGTADVHVAKLPPKTAEEFYLSRPWRSLVDQIKKDRGACCEACGERESQRVRLIGDHIVERKDGGADLDAANIRLLCRPCHNRKTAQARAARLSAPVRRP